MFNNDIERKKKQRESITQGILYHASIENSPKKRSHFLLLLERMSEHYFHELEVWQKKHEKTQFLSATRNVIDFVALYEIDNFINIFKEIKNNNMISLEIENKEVLDLIALQNKETKNKKIIIVLDYKTGQKKDRYLEQIEKYMKLANHLAKSGWFDTQNKGFSFLIVGIIYYKNILENKEYLYFYKGIL